MFAEYLPYKIIDKYIILNLKISPNAIKNKFGKIEIINENNRQIYGLKLFITEIAQDGKANLAIISFLSKYFNITKSNIKICPGSEFTRFKKIEIGSFTKETINLLDSLLN